MAGEGGSTEELAPTPQQAKGGGRGQILNPALTCTITRNDPEVACTMAEEGVKSEWRLVKRLFEHLTTSGKEGIKT